MDEQMLSSLAGKEIPESLTIENVFEIEDLLVAINKLNKKIDFLKGLKENRVAAINGEIEGLDNKVAWLRDQVCSALRSFSPNEKTLNFPGVAKVTRKMQKGTWDIQDETQVTEFLAEQGFKDQVVQTKEVLDKKKAKDLLEQLNKMKMIIPGAARKEDKESVSITFASGEIKPQNQDSTKNIDELDALEL